jgi:predicted GNAT family acetyltransferase
VARLPTDDVDVVNDTDASRYEISVDGALAGFLRYRRLPDRTVFIHTEIDTAYEGHGLGVRLVRAALDDLRRRGEQLSPICPFVVEYLRRHPDYLDLVDERRRSVVTDDAPPS